MSGTALRCYHCGASLAALSLPLGRLDECPQCTTPVHVCRMCRFFDPRVADQCTEDDAPAVQNKKAPNFCDYFKPSPDAYTGQEQAQAARAAQELAALFGTRRPPADPGPAPGDSARAAAEDLFGRKPEP